MKQHTRRTYRVLATSHQSFEIYVEAESEDQAYSIGKKVDGGYWQPVHDGDWEVDSAEPASNIPREQLLDPAAYDTL